MAEVEDLQRALAHMIVWARSEVVCPWHDHTDAVLLTPDGPTTIHQPICELLDMECTFRHSRSLAIKQAEVVLGTEDIGQFL